MASSHVNPEEAVKIHKILQTKKSIAVHFGTFQQADESYAEQVKDLEIVLAAQEISDTSFEALMPGEYRFLD